MKHEGVDWSDNPRARLVDRAYDEIRQALVTELRPGDRITEAHLAQTLGMSKTPIREALRQLEQDRMITAIPRVGYLVPNITYQDVKEVYDLREALEGKAASLAAASLTDDALSELTTSAEALEGVLSDKALDEYAAFNTQLHSAIVASTGNQRLDHSLRRMRGQIDGATQQFLANNLERFERSHGEHLCILDALRQRDAAKAEAAMRDHIKSVRATILELFR